MSKLGFIELGIMSRPMAGHLVAGGHKLFLHDLVPLPDELLGKGAFACKSGKEVAEWSDIIILMVPDTPHVEAALFGPSGVAEGLGRGKVVVDMSSISPIDTKRFAKKINQLGCEYLDAPVSGGEVGAKQASLTIMVGGRGDLRQGEAALRSDGQERDAGRRQWRRPDLQSRKPDHRRAHHRGGGRGVALCFKGGRRPCEGAGGSDGRLCFLAYP